MNKEFMDKCFTKVVESQPLEISIYGLLLIIGTVLIGFLWGILIFRKIEQDSDRENEDFDDKNKKLHQEYLDLIAEDKRLGRDIIRIPTKLERNI